MDSTPVNRRQLLAGAAFAAAGWALWQKPANHGAPYDSYFCALNSELKRNGPMRPCMLIDLDRLDRNIDLVVTRLRGAGKQYRIVEKSLPSQKLIEYIAQRANTQRLMSFNQPFLSLDAEAFPGFDILMGKPLPVRAAQLFYQQLKGPFDPARQLQWLIDTPQRLAEYLHLARGLGARLRANIEIDVGLHRGGVKDHTTLGQILDAIAANSRYLEFAGFMGYDGHVGMGVPHILGAAQDLLGKAMAIYQGFVNYARTHRSKLWREDLTLNAGGSAGYKLHLSSEKLSSELSVGTALLKPSHYDLETLAEHAPAAYIATPVIKATGAVLLPAIDAGSKILSWWDPNQRATFFIYGGWWRGDYESPQGLQFNEIYGHSANQEIVNGSPEVGLRVDDHVFLRPMISESVLLEFGDLIAVRGTRIVAYWPVFRT